MTGNGQGVEAQRGWATLGEGTGQGWGLEAGTLADGAGLVLGGRCCGLPRVFHLREGRPSAAGS